jgi:hypothetical protein
MKKKEVFGDVWGQLPTAPPNTALASSPASSTVSLAFIKQTVKGQPGLVHIQLTHARKAHTPKASRSRTRTRPGSRAHVTWHGEDIVFYGQRF